MAQGAQQQAPHRTADAPDFTPPRINWLNLVWVALILGAMIVVIHVQHLWTLNFMHVAAGMLWTGIDLFMGFVVGPALRKSPFAARRAVMTQLTPKTLFILPTLSIVTGTTGWYLAGQLGLLDAPWPQQWWVVAALAIVTVLTIQGLGYLLPTQIRIYRELCKPQPDVARIQTLSRAYFWVIASQGLMQVGIVVVMAKFRMGL